MFHLTPLIMTPLIRRGPYLLARAAARADQAYRYQELPAVEAIVRCVIANLTFRCVYNSNINDV